MTDRHQTIRARGAAAALLVHALIGLALIRGLGVEAPKAVDEVLKAFDVLPPEPPAEIETPELEPLQVEVPVEAERYSPGEEGAASPPNIVSRATPVVAPPPEIALPAPSPVVAAQTPSTGADASTGAAEVPGPGTGAGGSGAGSGSGAGGGGGGGGGFFRNSPPRRIAGRLGNSDYPRWAFEARVGGTVAVRYTVGTNGRVSNCRILRSSGSAELDALTCRLIEQRFRFRPSRTPEGQAVAADVAENHSWIVEDLPPEPRR